MAFREDQWMIWTLGLGLDAYKDFCDTTDCTKPRGGILSVGRALPGSLGRELAPIHGKIHADADVADDCEPSVRTLQ